MHHAKRDRLWGCLSLVALAWVGFALVGFRCGTLAQDCLVDTDCSTPQRCVVFRCLAQTDEPSPELSENERPDAEPSENERPAAEPSENERPDAEPSEHEPAEAGDCDGEAMGCRLGAWCDGDASCKSGLTCHQGRCMTPCDPEVSVRSNPACAPEGTISVCFALTPNTGICKHLCSARKSSPYTDPNCPLGTYCVDQSGIYDPGVCTPTTAPARGTRLLGQTCTKIPKEDDCNGDQQLVCALSGATQRCLLACDPRQTGGCPAETLCQGTNLSFLGGVCQSQ